MFRQIGPLKTDDQGIGYQGLLARHLILPADTSNSLEILKALASISLEIPISLMAQYRPCFKTHEVPEINRGLHSGEYDEVVALAEKLGFEAIFIQELESAEVYLPDFTLIDPFSDKR
jgi:putative pyruvate formate lyase activating enzyme